MADAQERLANLYFIGGGDYFREDHAKAAKWYRKLAEQGDVRGYYMLGVMYDSGYGVPEDDSEALKWWQKGADLGDERCKDRIKGHYELVKRNKEEAEKWAARERAEDAYDAKLRKQFGFNPRYAPISSLVATGKQFNLVYNYLNNGGGVDLYNGGIPQYFFKLAADYGYSKRYYLYNNPGVPRLKAIVSVSNNKITSVRWY